MATTSTSSFGEGGNRRLVVVVAVDLGTTHSGYAFSFFRDPSSVYVMTRWAGQEPGLLNHKTLSALLLTPDGTFHSFGLAARNHYHNLLPIEARHWLYFERFKMTLHHCKELSRDTMVTAVNGQQMPALTVFSHVLTFFATHALEQLSDQSGTDFRREDVRWVVTVPAIWREPAKQLMRQAAQMAGMFTSDNPSQMLIVLEPEAASVYCRRLRMHQLVPETGTTRPLQSSRRSTTDITMSPPAVTNLTVGSRYIVVDAGGGTVDITVHELKDTGQLVELHRATGGPHGSTGVDEEFIALLCSIFGHDFVDNYKRNFPVGWVNLLTDFESRKRTASPLKTTSFNISLPFTFISEFRKHKGEIDHAVKRHGDSDVEWSLQGMLRLAPPAMHRLFAPTLISIRQAVGDVLNHPNTRDLQYLFLVGGFAESPMLQHEIRREFGQLLTVLIPHDVSLAVLRGAVLFGLDPKVVSVRCARLTYGVGVLNRFDSSRHPPEKLVHRDGVDWCTDVFDRFVAINQPVALGTCVTRRYTPARAGQMLIVLNVYSSTLPEPTFITDSGVRKCGTLCLDLRRSSTSEQQQHVGGSDSEETSSAAPTGIDRPREILARMSFGDTEISVAALDVTSGKEVKATIDFLSG
ncbi:heat shock 70 kDa protein 12A-like isoform X2 [Pomacea canaliculata]|uniref:heat shock 70 kDa protein 12A-like isoform X2 n=1 Tax=Pomacea canaliculata TaxID=400727 RepID=UPI000D73492B|nr:heat shock 70 kDa protein 12A-like isoform X2 [Pomacea canaliculata]